MLGTIGRHADVYQHKRRGGGGGGGKGLGFTGVYEPIILTLSLYGVITVKNRKEISESTDFTMLPNCGNLISYDIII